jgi:glycyl-tRNA synthetase
VPFAITVDYDTIQEGELQHTVTLRERDSMEQVRVPMKELAAALRGLCDHTVGAWTWADMKEKYPIQVPPAEA